MDQDSLTLDETDRAILQVLQHDARHATTEEVGDAVGVSRATVSKRIADLEEAGVIQDYTVRLDYDRIGVNPKMLLVCTVPAAERERYGEEAIDLDGVIDVRTVLTGERNLHVTVVGREMRELSTVCQRLEELGVDIVDSGVVRSEHRSPFDHFGEAAVDDI